MASTDPTAEKDAGQTTGTSVNGGNPTTQRYDYGGNPLAHIHSGPDARLPAFGGEFQPGLWKQPENRKFANPAPLGLSAFALTTFVLSAVNLETRGVTAPNIAVPLALGYGGLVQLLAGMWYAQICPRSWDRLVARMSKDPLTRLILGKWRWATPSVLLLCPLTAVSGSPTAFS